MSRAGEMTHTASPEGWHKKHLRTSRIATLPLSAGSHARRLING